MNFAAKPLFDDVRDQSQLSAPVSLDSYEAFSNSFPLQGEYLYSLLFERHNEQIQTQKAKFAIANLERIISAALQISLKSGFDRMTLRDLSTVAEVSMGSIYSCIRNKEDIALMIADVVRLSSDLTEHHASQAETCWQQLQQSIRFHLYASTVLQPWYLFLYLETRCLPEQQQQESKKIEIDAINGFEKLIKVGIERGEFDQVNAKAVANMIVTLLEDWYLKPWKTKVFSNDQTSNKMRQKVLDQYFESLVSMVQKLLIKT